jgi:hypothetical protein
MRGHIWANFSSDTYKNLPPVGAIKEFLKLSPEQLDDVFRNAPAGAIPIGQGDGTAIIASGNVCCRSLHRSQISKDL